MTTKKRMTPKCLPQSRALCVVGDCMLRSTNARANPIAAPIDLGSSSEDEDDDKDNVNVNVRNNNNNDGNNDTHMSAMDAGDHAPHSCRSVHALVGEDTC
jgi:hypothetical protein